jgi:hypothetical protein
MADKDPKDMDEIELFGRYMHVVVDHEEKLKLEIYALRKTLEVYANPKPSADAPLEKIVKDLMDDPIVQNIVHHEFDEARRQIDDLIREGKLTQLLHSMTPEGPVN